MNQKGFATLEVILMVMVIGILATVAVPRFTDVTTKANTAKIQSDLATIDSAIDMYQMETGNKPTAGNISSETDATTTTANELSPYIKDIKNLKPPEGSAYKGGSEGEKITAKTYAVNGETPARATLDGKTAGEFYKKS